MPRKPPNQENKPPKAKKSPFEKRSEKAAEREQWTDEDIAKAFEAAGGTPKGKEQKHPGGRPSEYTRIDLAMVEKLCRIGSTNEQMAAFFEVSLATWYNWQREHPEFLDAIHKGKDHADDLVEQSLFQQAVGFSHPEDKIFYDNQVGKVVTVPTIKRYRGDTAAAFIWLKNRRPAQWRDRMDPVNPNPETTAAALARLADSLQAAHG